MTIYNHTSVASFAGLTAGQISAAAALTLMLRRASTGGLISTALDTLETGDARLDRVNWDFQDRGNPGYALKISDFTDQCALQYSTHTVLSMKFCYIDPDAVWVEYRNAMLAAESAYPANTFVWWSLPLTTYYELDVRAAYNASCRSYCAANNKTLFDIADIESYHANGTANTYEGYEALCEEYTSDGGHPDSNGGDTRLAQVFWVMMADLAGPPPSLSFNSRSYTQTVSGTVYGIRRYNIE
jgi:hypothetical protein